MNAKAILSTVIALAACAACFAADPAAVATAPVTLNISGDAVPITSALDMLAKQTSTTILYDSTVRGKLGESHIKLASIDAMFDFLKAKDAGLTVQSLYVPSDKPVPTAAQLVTFVNALKQIQASGLVVMGKDDNSTITFSHGNAPDTAPTGMKKVYLVTNEATRAQIVADDAAQQQKIAAAAAAAMPGGVGPQAYQSGANLPPQSLPAQGANQVPQTDPQAAARAAYRQKMREQRAAQRAQQAQNAQNAQPSN